MNRNGPNKKQTVQTPTQYYHNQECTNNFNYSQLSVLQSRWMQSNSEKQQNRMKGITNMKNRKHLLLVWRRGYCMVQVASEMVYYWSRNCQFCVKTPKAVTCTWKLMKIIGARMRGCVGLNCRHFHPSFMQIRRVLTELYFVDVVKVDDSRNFDCCSLAQWRSTLHHSRSVDPVMIKIGWVLNELLTVLF